MHRLASSSVLARKFARDAEALAHVAIFVTELANIAAPRRRLYVVADDADNRILECAGAGPADIIVTGDKALLALKTHVGIPIMSLSAYLDTEVASTE